MNKFTALKAVIEYQNITKAAKALGYTQPAVTQMIKSLELELGFALLIKKHNQIKLTPNGTKIYPFIDRIINDYLALDDKKKEINHENSIIKIATIPSISQQWLPQLIANFQIDHPKTDFSILQGDCTSIPDWVQNGNADIGFVNLGHHSKTTGTVIQRQTLKAILPLAWQNHFSPIISLKDLTERPYVLLEEGLFSESLSAYEQLKLEPNVKMRLHDSFSTILMVEQGIGYSIMPMDKETEQQHHIKSFNTKPAIQREISLIHKDTSIMSSVAKAFVESVKMQTQINPER